MATETEKLAAIRDEIDHIDNQIHDLLMRRTEVVHEVAKIKNNHHGTQSLVPSLAWRPDREAAILRRLAARHRGTLPFHVVAQVWRELLAAATQQQGPFSLALARVGDRVREQRIWDLAKIYYGSQSPIELFDGPAQAIAAVATQPGMVGLLPAPAPGIDWWDSLAQAWGSNPEGLPGPCIISAVPFVVAEAAPVPEALTLACLEAGATGDDTSWVVLHADGRLDNFEALAPFEEAGLKPRILTHKVEGARKSRLVGLEGHLTAAGLSALSNKFPDGVAAELLGVFANPIVWPASGEAV